MSSDDNPLPKAYIAHAIAGRTRIKIPSKTRDEDYFKSVAECLLEARWVTRVETNASSASLLVFHSKVSNLPQYALVFKLFFLEQPTVETTLEGVSSVYASWNESLKSSTGGRMDIPGATILAFITSGIWEISQGNVGLPPWYTAFFYALGTYVYAKTLKGKE